MSNELATRMQGVQIHTMDELARIADMMAKSGFFSDAREAAQAGVKILAGQAWGIDPFSAMTGISIIQGRPAIGAGIMASKVKGHPKYDYKVLRLDGEGCEIEFYQGNDSLGVSTFTLEDAKAAGYAGKQNYKATPRNMLFARALSNGVRWFTPDVFAAPVYVPEEFGADGDAVEVERVDRPVDRKALEAAKAEPVTPEPVESDEFPPEGDGPLFDKITAAQVKAITTAMKPLVLGPAQAKALVESILDHEIDGILNLSHADGELLAEITTDQYAEALDAMRVPA
jgi:hypothetical protein